MNNKTQHDKFKEAAKELGCDEDAARFDEMVKKVAKAKVDLTKKSDSDSIGKGEKPKK